MSGDINNIVRFWALENSTRAIQYLLLSQPLTVVKIFENKLGMITC